MSVMEALDGVLNVSQPLPWLVTAGQPTAEQFAAVRDAGVRVIIDLRDPMEPRPYDEDAAVRELGMEYLNFPVVSGALGDELLEKILDALRKLENTSVILHCNSSNRVGGALIPYFMLDQGMEEQDAVDLAMSLGLRSVEMMEWGLGYARSKKS